MKVTAKTHVKYHGTWYSAGEAFDIADSEYAGMEGLVEGAAKKAAPAPAPQPTLMDLADEPKPEKKPETKPRTRRPAK